MQLKIRYAILILLLSLTYFLSAQTKPRIEKEIIVDGIKRHFVINFPESFEKSAKFPLIIAMHGGGGSAEQCEKDYDLNSVALKENFIVVYPEGVRGDGILKIRTWNAGTCCQYAAENNIDDVKFISTLIDELVNRYKGDSERVYLTGMSNGAMMAYRLNCEIADKIRAIAVVSGTMTTKQTCSPSKAVPILHIHSERDERVPPQGGKGIRGYHFPSVDSTLAVLALVNGCNEKPIIEKHAGYTKFIWEKNSRNVIEYYLTKDGGHSWPGSKKSRLLADKPSTVIDANSLIIDFFKKN